ncbi:Magnesium transporter MRS2-7 [Vitis vinifera]|uniref:Magnesium transporter MRS2-7 n=1 Tax=Vitis vinifera TaxID=29760 RepID=A0A438C9T5_VITVI|nr:Magnesium transporter MRS2-7 [Vitis vinifera]
MLLPERQIPPWGHTNTTTEEGKEYKDVNNPNNPSSSNHPQQCSPKDLDMDVEGLRFRETPFGEVLAWKFGEVVLYGGVGSWGLALELVRGGLLVGRYTGIISSLNLDRVRKLKSAMTRLTARVQKGMLEFQKVRDELEQLLDDDDDMADLYLSRKLAGASSPVSGFSVATVRGDENDVEELEMLLELREYIDDTEDYINIQLDNHRNQLIQVVIVTGVSCVLLFVVIMSYARHKGLVGS